MPSCTGTRLNIGLLLRFLQLSFLLLISAQCLFAQSNPIVTENSLPGNPPSEWDVDGVGDPTIQGFATDISIKRGETIQFKVKTDATNYRLDIYRLGYYNGLGARFIASLVPSAPLPQTQPDPIVDPSTGLVDCGNWAVSASWTVPANATSGVYIARLVRADTDGASHIIFVVRDDAGQSDILFQTSDTTWQAYNGYGGNSLYFGEPAGRAYKVSYNRPLIIRGDNNSLFSAEYPMIRWLEANGYNVSYATGVDTDRRGNLLTNHKVFLSVGHDEYWSGQQRSNVEAARDAGVHLAFFSGNEIFWKTRWETSIDGSGTPYRTLVCYKETHAAAKIDPTSGWTGTWRDPRFSPPSDGGRPENSLTGTLFSVISTNSIVVPGSYGTHRFWRNTSVSTLNPAEVASFAPGTLGYEWDECPYNGFQPAGLMRLSEATVTVSSRLVDYGSIYTGQQATHNLVLYRHSSGALVFGAGTVQWSWGLDSVHDNGSAPADISMQQVTVNLFADMSVQPASLQAGLIPAAQSTDTVAPSSVVHAPLPGSILQTGSQVTVSGTATDSGGGRVWSVEVSTDGGTNWYPAVGRENWTLAWTPAVPGPVTIKTRAVDDSGNLETPSSGVAVTVAGGQTTIWSSSTVPALSDSGPDHSVELGVKFYSEVGGTVKGIRFYKSSANTGTHVANLWSSTGTLLASAEFTEETTSGWHQASFATPVPINSFTIYVASYHTNTGHYSADANYFSSIGADNSPLHAPPSGGSWGSNGVYAYGESSTFPDQTWNNTNYWVDVVVQPGPPPVLTSIAVTPANPTALTGATQQFTATGTYFNGTTQDISSEVGWSSSAPAVATINATGLAIGVSTGTTTISATQSGLTGLTTLTVQTASLAITTGTSLPNGTVNAGYSTSLAVSGGTPPYTWAIVGGSLPPGLTLASGTGAISGTPTATGNFSFTAQVTDSSAPAQSATKEFNLTSTNATTTIWPSTAVPGIADGGPDNPVELGVKFRSDVSGTIRGIRFYKAAANTGTHIGNLWSSTGSLLATGTFSNETASGWQQLIFTTPVAITANTVYVASYHANTGHYSVNTNYFASSGVDNAPLHALANGVSGGNDVYRYGAGSAFPDQSWNSSNYWVDVVFEPALPPTLDSIAVTPANPNITTGTTQQITATGTYSDGSTQNITSQVTWTSSNTSVATINSAGLASGTAPGSTTVTAALSGKTGLTTLTVLAAPLTITTSALPNSALNTAYSATLTGSGGTLPYGWSLESGSLPTGLALSTGGTISGTPTAAGSFNFTVRLSDSAAQSVTKALSITVSASASVTIWSSTVPAVADSGPDSAVQLGVKLRSDVAGTIRGIRFYKGAGNTGTHVGSLWSSGGTRLANATFTNETASGWQEVLFATPVAVEANTVYVASYHTTTGHYSINSNYFASTGADNAPLHAPANSVSGGNGVFRYGASDLFPNQSWNASNYWVDVIFQSN